MSFPEEKHQISDLEWSVNSLLAAVQISRVRIEETKAKIAELNEMLIYESRFLTQNEATLENCIKLLADAKKHAGKAS